MLVGWDSLEFEPSAGPSFGQLWGRAGTSAEGGQGPSLPQLRATLTSGSSSGKSGIVWFLSPHSGDAVMECKDVLVSWFPAK